MPKPRTAHRVSSEATPGAQRLLAAKIKEFSACAKLGLRAASIKSAATLKECFDHVTRDAKGKVAGKKRKLADVIAEECAGVDLDAAFWGSCHGRANDFAACLDERVACRVCLTLNDTGGLTGNCDLFDDHIVNGSCQ